MRKLASIVKISACTPISGTDRLSVATMEGNSWRVVTGRDEFKSGDVGVYFEIDSALNPEDSRYEFLKDRCLRKFVSKAGKVLKEVLRIKTIRLRGEVSQGLLMPVEKFPELTDQMSNDSTGEPWILRNGFAVKAVGEDVTDDLAVEHYDELKEALAPECGCQSIPSDARLSDFPSFLCPKSDEDRIQIHPEYFEDLKGRKFEVTEKRDGSSVTMIYSPRLDTEPFAVCSRNMRLRRVTERGKIIPQPWKTCIEKNCEEKISGYCKSNSCELAFQGELQGAGINSNRDILPEFIWQVFKVYDCIGQMYLLPDEARELCKEIGLEYVPVIEEECPVFERFNSDAELLKFAEGKTARGNEREGLVFKSCNYPYVSFKAVSNRYLCKEGD